MSNFDLNLARRNLSALVDFSNLINSSLDLKFISNNLLLTCFGKFHTTKGVVILLEDKEIRIIASKGLSDKVKNEFPKTKLNGLCSESPELKECLDHLKMHFCVDIVTSRGPIGALFLGERLNKAEYTSEDKDFVTTLVNIAATAIENSLTFDKLKTANRSLDSKVSMLSSLFELSKEFSGVLEVQRVSKLLIYSVIGQLLVSNYAVIVYDEEGINILDSKYPKRLLHESLKNYNINKFDASYKRSKILSRFPELASIGVELIVPMQVQGVTKGIVLLGKRFNLESYSDIDIEFIYSACSLAMISIENAQLFKEALEKHRMEEDLQIARNIQKNLFPRSVPKLKHFEIAAMNLPTKQVGGDYYDLIKLDDNNCLFAVGDVSGKGVPASLLMANLQAFLKSICKQGLELNQATDLINDLISENTMGENFITFFWGILDSENKKLTYVNAGHNPPYLIRNGVIQKLKTGGMILGFMKTLVPYLCETIDLIEGDTLILFTDGITEAMNKKMEEFSEERLENFVVNICEKNSSEILNEIKSEVEKFVEGANQSDDITLMVINVS